MLTKIKCKSTTYKVAQEVFVQSLHRDNQGKLFTSFLCQFITQYRCQKFMKEEWLSGQPEWSRKKGFWWSLLYSIFAIFVYGILFQLLPVHLIVCKTYRLRHLIYSPKTAFLGHFLSYLFFLCVIFTYQVMVSYKIEGSHVVIESKGNHIPILVLCIIWFGLLFIEELIQVIIKGSTHYFKNMWNRLDLIILLSFFVGVVIGNPLIVTQPFDDPYISIYLSKFTSLTFIFALLRFMEPFYLSNFVGPILLIFTEMRHDIFRFLTIFIYVVTACAMAMYYVYVGVTVEENRSEFAHFPTSLSSLVITIFGGDASQSLIVDGPELSNFTSDAESTGKEPAYTYFTLLGYILYIMFGTITLIMLLNLCIAMMSDRYTKLQAEIDLVWTFERSRIWMGYIGGDGPNLNAMSFVLVVSALSIGLFIISINKCYNLCHTKRRRRKVSHGISKETELQEVRTGKDSSKKTKTNEDEQVGTTTAAEGSEKTDKNETKLERETRASDSSEETKTNEDEQMGTTTAAEGSEKTDKNETKLERETRVNDSSEGTKTNEDEQMGTTTAAEGSGTDKNENKEEKEIESGDSSEETKTNEDEQMGTTTAAEGSEKTNKNESKEERATRSGDNSKETKTNETKVERETRASDNSEKTKMDKVPDFEEFIKILLHRYFKKFARPLGMAKDDE